MKKQTLTLLLSLLVVLAAVLIVGIALAGLLAFIGVTAQKQQTWNLSISEISEALVEDESAPGKYHFSMQQVLDEDQLWAMLIGQDGEILWGYDLPEDLPERYSLTDVASFSRWYLRDYPVQVWVREDGLLVVGEPKGSTWKYAFSMDREILDLVPYWAGMVFFLALACVVGVSYLLLRLWFRSDQNKRDQARSDWINGISHDIRTPLSVVMGYASQMESDGSLGEHQREQAGIIRLQSQEIRDLVNDLNLTMRLDYEMQPLRKAPLSPAALIRQTAADFLNGGLDEKYSIEVQIDRSAQSLTLEADQFLLLRALANRGGVAGLNFYGPFLGTETESRVQEMVRHVLHMIDVGGSSLPAIGTDLDGFDGMEAMDIPDVSGMERLWDALKRKGLSERQLDKIWSGNALRVIP